jgi:nitrite reductase (NADH) small subunit/3-phenylpropionate/trans-cinnamate dioxygenase ferredoxin subunit
MAEFERVARVGDIPEGQGRAYLVKRHLIAVFNVQGEYRAINDSCPHMGASLAQGYLEGDIVYCPWHAWRFCVCDGLWADAPKSNLRTPTYEVQVTNGEICVRVPDVEAPAESEGSQEPRN